MFGFVSWSSWSNGANCNLGFLKRSILSSKKLLVLMQFGIVSLQVLFDRIIVSVGIVSLNKKLSYKSWSANCGSHTAWHMQFGACDCRTLFFTALSQPKPGSSYLQNRTTVSVQVLGIFILSGNLQALWN